jgi:hypothetical protein
MLSYFACEAAGALSARHSLRPLIFQAAKRTAKLGHAPRDREVVSIAQEAGDDTAVIARSACEEAIQLSGL